MRVLWHLLFFGLLLGPWSLASATVTSPDPLAEQRALFLEARAALNRDQRQRFRELAARIPDYPLQPYLQFWELQRYLSAQTDASIQAFLDAHPDTGLSRRLRSAWLQQLALWFRPLQQPRYAMAFATLALVIAAAVWILVPRHQADLMADANETLTQDEILAYIETNIEDFDTYLLLAALDDNSLMEVAPTGLDEKAREDLLDAILKELDASMLEELL